MQSSFNNEDVTLLLKDITGMVTPLDTNEREQYIQSGVHYSEMLPLEYRPTNDYIRIYEDSLRIFGKQTAEAVEWVSEKIINLKGENVVLVSLARAGTPIGVLIKRYIKEKYGYICPHYSISIIRDRGIDKNAINFVLSRHKAEDIQFVDGWTGKGVIYKELRKEIRKFDGISDELAVLSDPAHITELFGTHDDIMIPSSCLNCTVCGLISRTFLRSDIIGENDFHGAAYYGDLISQDRTYEFIDSIVRGFDFNLDFKQEASCAEADDIQYLSEKYKISNVNFIKPGIGETTRVLLRRVPWKVVIDADYKDSIELNHIRQLARERNVDIEYDTLESYKCCGIIKQLSDI